ncbi:hypothetical protein FOL47_004976, partial [Perkinsus chesapeaki]
APPSRPSQNYQVAGGVYVPVNNTTAATNGNVTVISGGETTLERVVSGGGTIPIPTARPIAIVIARLMNAAVGGYKLLALSSNKPFNMWVELMLPSGEWIWLEMVIGTKRGYRNAAITLKVPQKEPISGLRISSLTMVQMSYCWSLPDAWKQWLIESGRPYAVQFSVDEGGNTGGDDRCLLVSCRTVHELDVLLLAVERRIAGKIEDFSEKFTVLILEHRTGGWEKKLLKIAKGWLLVYDSRDEEGSWLLDSVQLSDSLTIRSLSDSGNLLPSPLGRRRHENETIDYNIQLSKKLFLDVEEVIDLDLFKNVARKMVILLPRSSGERDRLVTALRLAMSVEPLPRPVSCVREQLESRVQRLIGEVEELKSELLLSRKLDRKDLLPSSANVTSSLMPIKLDGGQDSLLEALQDGASKMVDSIKTSLSPGPEFAALRDDEEHHTDNSIYLRRPHGNIAFSRAFTVSESPTVKYAPRRHQSGDLAARLQKTADVASARLSSPVIETAARRKSTGSSLGKPRSRRGTPSSSPALDNLLAQPIHADPHGSPTVDESFAVLPLAGIEPARDPVPEVEFTPHGELGELADLSALYDEVGNPIAEFDGEERHFDDSQKVEGPGIVPESLVGELTRMPTGELVALIRRVIELRPDVAVALFVGFTPPVALTAPRRRRPHLEGVNEWRKKHYVFLQPIRLLRGEHVNNLFVIIDIISDFVLPPQEVDCPDEPAKHGIWGHNSDLLAVREALLSQCKTRLSESSGLYVDPTTKEEIQVITVISNVNTGKTHDGAKEGGENLFRLVEDTCEAGSYISLIGHSLGGLYCRAALRLLAAQPSRYPYADPSETIGSLGLVPVNYISFATPHLGLREMPAVVQFGALVVSGKTGSDLLLRSDTLGEWLIDEDALRGLALCKRRIVYANVANDLMVGPWTSAISDGFPEEVSMRCRAHPRQPVEVSQEVLDTFRAYRASGIRMRGEVSKPAMKRGASSNSSSRSARKNSSVRSFSVREMNSSTLSAPARLFDSEAGDGSFDDSSDSGEMKGEEVTLPKMKKNKKCLKNLNCEQLAKLRRMIKALETLEWTPYPCDWRYSLSFDYKLSGSSESIGTNNSEESASKWERYLVYYRKPRIENPGNGAHLKIINIDVSKSGAGDSVLAHMASNRFLWLPSADVDAEDGSPCTTQSTETSTKHSASKVLARAPTTAISPPSSSRRYKMSL